MVSIVLSCRLIPMPLRAAPFNVTIIQVYAPTLDMMTMRLTTSIGNSRKSLTKHLRRAFWLYKGSGMLKLEDMHRRTRGTYVDSTENIERGLRLLDFATFNNLVLKNNLGPHNHPESGHGTAQTGSITTRFIAIW